MLVTFDHPISTESAKILSDSTTSTILGFRHEQDNVVGEFFPTEDYTLDDFAADFRSDYGVAPELIGAILPESPTDELASTRADSSDIFDIARELPTFDAPEVKLGIIAEQSLAADNPRGSAEEPGFGIAATGWQPSYTEVYAMNIPGLRAIGTFVEWDPLEGSNPNNVENDDWGLELDAYQRNDDVTGSLRPVCVPASYMQEFWAARDNPGWNPFFSWSVQFVSGYDNNPNAYLDWVDISDECSIQATTVGIGHPREIANRGPNLGRYTITTLIKTNPGRKTSSRAGFYHQLVSNDCIGTPASTCMGLNTGREHPGGNASIVLPYSQVYYFPGCYSRYLSQPVQSISCE